MADAEMPTAGGARRAAWNGHDFYAVLGGRSWEDCRRLGFISAGGGEFYSKPLEALFPGARVFTYKPGAGYVGIGRVLARSVPITEFKVASNAEAQLLLLEVPGLDARFREFHEHPQKREHVVAVEWIATKSAKEAVWDTGLFANQNTVCRLRDQDTIDFVTERFGVPKAGGAGQAPDDASPSAV